MDSCVPQHTVFQNSDAHVIFLSLEFLLPGLVSFSLFLFGFAGPCLFSGRGKKSQNINPLSVQSFILLLMAYSDSLCSKIVSDQDAI